MKCIKNPTKQVLVSDCETCLSSRKADPICFQRGFGWGFPDDSEPKWAISIQEAKRINEDVSMYYDILWEGNTHLLPPPQTYGNAGCKKKKISSKIRWAVWERDNFTCQVCGTRKNLSIDHIHPESKGGTLDLSNLQTLCCRCNSLKGTD